MTMTTDLQPGPDATGSKPTADTKLQRVMGDQLPPDGNPPPPTVAVRLARIAGLLYLVMAIFGGFAQIVRLKIYEPGEAAATAANIVANATLVRLSFVADLIQALVWLVLAGTLYPLLAHAGRELARAMVVFVGVSVAISSLNMVHQLGALLVAPDHPYASDLGPNGSHALVLLL